jgi:hypothetical protein
MTSTRAAAYIGSASLMLAWLASASGVPRQPRATSAPSRPGDSAVLQSIASDVQAQAARLRHRLATAPAPKGPIRNPFAFGSREMPSVRTRHAEPIVPMAVELPPPPIESPPTLLGIAEQVTPGGRIRTAMFSSAGDELIMVVEGETIGRYRVTAIGADAVEIQDTSTGALRRLPLQ